MRILYTFIFLFISMILNGQNVEDRAKISFYAAEEAYNTGDYNAAIDNLTQVEKILGQTNSTILGLKVRAFYNNKDYVNAYLNKMQYFKLSNRNHPDYDLILRMTLDIDNQAYTVLVKEIEKYLASGDYKLVVQYFEYLLTIQNKTNNINKEQIAEAYFMSAHYQKALLYFEELFQNSLKKNEKEQYAIKLLEISRKLNDQKKVAFYTDVLFEYKVQKMKLEEFERKKKEQELELEKKIIKNEEIATYNNAISKQDPKLFIEYLNKYPKGDYVIQIKENLSRYYLQRFNESYDIIIKQKIRQLTTLKEAYALSLTYFKYISGNTDTKDVRQKQTNLEALIALEESDLTKLNEFAYKYPVNEYIPEITSKINDLELKEKKENIKLGPTRHRISVAFLNYSYDKFSPFNTNVFETYNAGGFGMYVFYKTKFRWLYDYGVDNLNMDLNNRVSISSNLVNVNQLNYLGRSVGYLGVGVTRHIYNRFYVYLGSGFGYKRDRFSYDNKEFNVINYLDKDWGFISEMGITTIIVRNIALKTGVSQYHFGDRQFSIGISYFPF